MTDALRRRAAVRFRRIAGGFAESAFIHNRAREELLTRLEPLALNPARILDLGSGPGLGARALADRYRRASVVAVDHDAALLGAAQRRVGWLRPFRCVRADAYALPFADASFDLVFSNLLMPWLSDPGRFFLEVRRVLRPRGYFTATALGAETLVELREAFAAVETVAHVAAFPDLHDLGDALHTAGFVGPVLDADRVTVTFPTMEGLARDLRGSGAVPPAEARRGLTGRRLWSRAKAAYASRVDEAGRLPATCELVYLQGWAPDPTAPGRATGRETVVPVTQIRRRR
jgi:malonyl-CoA O-methyltransferase